MRTIVFVNTVSEVCDNAKFIVLQNNEYVSDNDNLIRLESIYKKYGHSFVDEFSCLLDILNKNNAKLFWWAYTSTAKNLLSSPLGERYFQIRAICEFVKYENVDVLMVVGATPGQIDAIILSLSKDDIQFAGKSLEEKRKKKLFLSVLTIIRQTLQFSRVFFVFLFHRQEKIIENIDVCLFTYIDSKKCEGIDNYFGKLPELINNIKNTSIVYLAYIYSPYKQRKNQSSIINSQFPYVALFGLLRFSDYIWSLYHASIAWIKNTLFFNHNIKSCEAKYLPLFQEIFLHDLSVGGYLHNLFVYKAIKRFLVLYKPEKIIYPYENKSLEKMILLGIENSQFKPESIGFQHSAITPRHLTLLFRPNEAKYTPLPKKIITVGKITKKYLETHGNYPPKIFKLGCALRQVWNEESIRQNNAEGPIKILLALSSSNNELIKSILFIKKVKELMPDIELGVRPHPSFPISVLPEELSCWVNENATDLSNTPVQSNLDWCNITVYVSTTVALESLMNGKPVININIGDIISSDSIIGNTSFHWRANNEIEMLKIIQSIISMQEIDYYNSSLNAIDYARNYLSPINNENLIAFTSAN